MRKLPHEPVPDVTRAEDPDSCLRPEGTPSESKATLSKLSTGALNLKNCQY
jgi:hypothetical protein